MNEADLGAPFLVQGLRQRRPRRTTKGPRRPTNPVHGGGGADDRLSEAYLALSRPPKVLSQEQNIEVGNSCKSRAGIIFLDVSVIAF